MTVAELGQRMGSREAAEWRAFFGLVEFPTAAASPAPPDATEVPGLNPDELYEQLDAMFGRGKGGRRE